MASYIHSLSSPLLPDVASPDTPGNDVLKTADTDDEGTNLTFGVTNTDEVKVFSFDRELLGRISKSFSRFMTLFWFASSLSGFTTLLFAVDGGLLFLVPYLALLLLHFYRALALQWRSERHRRERARVVVTRQFVFVDEVEAPGSNELRQRISHQFDKIQSCSVKQIKLFGHSISQVIIRNCNGDVILKIDGLREAHLLVEAVNSRLDLKMQPSSDGYIISEMNVV